MIRNLRGIGTVIGFFMIPAWAEAFGKVPFPVFIAGCVILLAMIWPRKEWQH